MFSMWLKVSGAIMARVHGRKELSAAQGEKNERPADPIPGAELLSADR
jgi:hypothetical protein